MVRTFLVTLVPCLLFAQTPGKVQEKGLEPATMELDQVGYMASGCSFHVKSILGEKEILVRTHVSSPMAVGGGGVYRGATPRIVYRTTLLPIPFALKGIDTTGLVDGKPLELKDIYRVTGTMKAEDRTIFVVEPATGDDRTKVQAAEQLEIEKRKAARKQYEDEIQRMAPVSAQPKAKKNPPKPAPRVESKESIPDAETDASRKLKLAKGFLPDDKDGARRRLKEVIEKYPDTKAAADAKEVLEKLDK